MFVFKVFLISLFLLIVAGFVVAAIGEALEKAEKFGREYYILVIGILIVILLYIINH
ncbi:hypothetical protein JT257_04205 [Helicobacter pylori]|nr:hypothetical protein [Helicobacter pylori]